MVVVDPKYTTTTERLLLRPMAMADAADILLMRSNPEVMLHTPLKPSDDMEQTKAWMQGCFDRDNNWNFSVELLSSAAERYPTEPRVIGLVGAVRSPEVGYIFNLSYWGKGYATEALKAFMPLFFEHYSGGEQPRFDYAEAHVDTELISSQNVLRKAGFELLEVREKDFENPILGIRDTCIFRRRRPGAEVCNPALPGACGLHKGRKNS
ncbi:acyl-CoA N-acyltransferase [Lojkania enalia]|uniref:Acyl-CoA N-acyltransferase n=1 Tax=Lojkania enalia TaxID=147567 RepID=A0A9P4KJG7_9PLEO|nr:acyl-CoA N-acyltransferase [Didymosphaeria enalia]